MGNKKKSNPIVLRRGMEIGTSGAEADDDFLFDCFIETPAYEALVNPTSPVMIVNGRTGSGKTALLRYIERYQEACRSVDPFDISMQYVANSDILRFLNDIGADLDLLFQLLWKHIICLEFIRMRFSVQNEERSKNFFSNITNRFHNDSRKKEAIAYLERYRDKFWVEMDKNVLELLEDYERKIEAELGADVGKIKTRTNYARQVSEAKKSQIVRRIKKIIDGEQHLHLAKVMELLKDPKISDSLRCHYILFDQLDQNWVDDTVRFRLIGALLETLKKFRKVPNLKIIVALRTDVIERVAIETHHVGSQREKLDDYSIRLVWTDDELFKLVETRVSLLFKRKYSGRQVLFNDLFTRNVANTKPFEYLIERSHRRPRDILAFINQCLKAAVDKNEITADSIREAEKEYSRVRMQALCQEWASLYPCLPILLKFAADNLHGKTFCEISAKEIWENLVLSLLDDKNWKGDKLRQHVEKVAAETTPTQILEFARETISILYRVGAISVKTSGDTRHQFSDKDIPLLAPSSIEGATKFRVHPMLSRELGSR